MPPSYPSTTLRFRICLSPVDIEAYTEINIRYETIELEETELYLTSLDDIAQALLVWRYELTALPPNTMLMFSDSQGRQRIFLRKDIKGWSFPESGPVLLDSLEVQLYIVDIGALIHQSITNTTAHHNRSPAPPSGQPSQPISTTVASVHNGNASPPASRPTAQQCN